MQKVIDLLDPSSIPFKGQLSPVDAAELLLDHVEDNLIYDGLSFHAWSGAYWEEVSDHLLDNLGPHFLGSRWGIKEHNNFLKLLKIKCFKQVDTDPYTVHLENYVLDLQDFTFKEPAEYKDRYSLGRLPVGYEPGARCDLWEMFLSTVMRASKEKIQLIKEFFGYCFLGDNRYQQALVLLGAGANGKSVLLEILSSLFNKVSTLDLKQIEDERFIHQLQGSWLNVCSELQYKSMESTAYIKAVIAGEPVYAAPKYHKGFTFRPRAKIAFATNGLPRNNDTSQGYFRRLLIVDMDYQVKNPDTKLISKLKEELPGILIWALDGLRELMRRGRFDYENPYLDLYKEESSSIYSWWADLGQEWMRSRAALGEIQYTELYQNYCEYCNHANMRPSARNKIRSEFERLQLPLEIYSGAKNVKLIKILDE